VVSVETRLQNEWSLAVVPKVFSVDPKRSATSCQGICGYISVMATLLLIIYSKGIMFCLRLLRKLFD